jgi:PKD repeat protein
MKRLFIKLLICLPLTGAVMLSSCQKNPLFPSTVVSGDKPAAAFTNTSGSLTVTFTNTSTNVESSYWQFGDGTTSTDKSPVHTYTANGSYTVILKTNSPAGYSSTVSKTFTVAGPATSLFTATPTFGLNVAFNSAASANVASVAWDFGDGTTATTGTVDHRFAAYATSYTVKLTVTGLLGDVVTTSQTVTVANNNLIKGGDFETSASAFWTVYSARNNNPPVYGYTGAKPSTGYDGCLRFPSFTNSAGFTELIYQAVQVTAGKQYQFSMQVKAPAGGKNDYLQTYISNDPNTWIESTAANANYFLCLNNYHAWGSTSSSTSAIDGDLYAATLVNGSYGLGVATGGVYTATFTGTVYIGIECGVYAGQSNGDILVDNVKFVQIN